MKNVYTFLINGLKCINVQYINIYTSISLKFLIYVYVQLNMYMYIKNTRTPLDIILPECHGTSGIPPCTYWLTDNSNYVSSKDINREARQIMEQFQKTKTIYI